MSEKELEEMEFRARHAVEPWRPEANYVGRLKEDLHRLIAEVRRLSKRDEPNTGISTAARREGRGT